MVLLCIIFDISMKKKLFGGLVLLFCLFWLYFVPYYQSSPEKVCPEYITDVVFLLVIHVIKIYTINSCLPFFWSPFSGAKVFQPQGFACAKQPDTLKGKASCLAQRVCEKQRTKG